LNERPETFYSRRRDPVDRQYRARRISRRPFFPPSSATMPVEVIHAIIGLMFAAICAMAGQVAVRKHGPVNKR